MGFSSLPCERVIHFLNGDHLHVSLRDMSREPEVDSHRLDSVSLGPVGGRPQVACQPVGEGGGLPIPALNVLTDLHLGPLLGFNISQSHTARA